MQQVYHLLQAIVSIQIGALPKKLLFYLKSAGHGPGDGVRDVYFGHTHKPVLDYTYDGVRFRNGGATVKGLRFHILELELPADED